LERTLLSLIPKLEGPCEKIIVGEDSGDKAIFDLVEPLRPNSPPIQIILNSQRLGISSNIDRIYKEVGTEWIFHCEDDWEFYRNGFINESFQVMQNESISSVNLRSISDFPLGFWKNAGGCYLTTQTGSGNYTGLHFNPGLRRMSDYRLIGPYEDIIPFCKERDVSNAYFAAGKRMAMLNKPAVRHIGGGAPHRPDT